MIAEPYLDLDNAKRHREQDRSLTNTYYDEQAKAVAQWGLAEPRPQNVRVGELPQVESKSEGLHQIIQLA